MLAIEILVPLMIGLPLQISLFIVIWKWLVSFRLKAPFINNPLLYPVVALNSALGFIKPLPIEERPLNQCHLLDQSIGDPVE
jgi:hypothetical protein